MAQATPACTEPRQGGNDRVRDVIDIWLLEVLLEPQQLADVKSAALQTYMRRQLHTWPPAVEATASWRRGYHGSARHTPILRATSTHLSGRFPW